ILVEADADLGGALLRDEDTLDGAPAQRWIDEVRATLGSAPETIVLTATTASMQLDQNGMLLAQRIGADLPAAARGNRPEQRLWQVRARRVILATGALERPIVFPDNDRPGIMLAGAARAYLRRYALAPDRGIVFTTNDDGYRTALAWHAAGVPVAHIVDTRPSGPGSLRQRALAAGISVLFESVVEGTTADAEGRLQSVRIRTPNGTLDVEGDLLAVSGGHEPNLNLHVQLRGDTTFDAALGAAVPASALRGQWIVGAARGEMSLAACLAGGAAAAREALQDLTGFTAGAGAIPSVASVPEDAPAPPAVIPAPDGDESRSFVDLHRDATVAGVQRAVNAGVRHIEHVKRFTLAGTGVEQGRSAKTNAALLTASLTGRPAADVGTSGSRPPYEPLPFHLLGGRARGARYEPVRTTALHARHEALGAVFEPAGQWMRPSRYPRPGESASETVRRECLAVRSGVGIIDVSTLGKIDVRGPDAAWFLDRLYANNIASIAVGRARYSVMCQMDGAIFDDGVVMRTGAQQFFVTTSTGHAASVVDWMEEWLQTEWPTHHVWVTPVTEQFATVAIAGPGSRALLAAVAPGLDVSNEGFPFNAVRHGEVAGIAGAQVARVSFSGELAYEVSVPWTSAATLWDALLASGAGLEVTPYGLDALQVLRIEKGFIIVGQDTEALTTPHDAGLGWLVGKEKDFVGRRSQQRPAMRRDDRAQLVGFRVLDSDEVLPEGAGLVSTVTPPPMPIAGHASSSRWSETLGCSLGLALVRGGRRRHGEVLYAPLLDGRVARVQLTAPVHYDPSGARRDG
ncbi:MAG TPA: glycine cleavage T C-terminal barrel domain-containing protein, partial [Gemmatimonadaceae bacterium]|nr:glycine cleavage T C-terminal barrel domain-containing protein [Gemmatimonadaceae bacterium]